MQVRTSGRADQRFHAPETIPTSEPAHHRPYLLEDNLTSEGARERPCSLERTGAGFHRCAAQLRGKRRTGTAYAGAAYMQLFKGRKIRGMVMEKNGIEIENLNLGKI